MAKEKSRWKYHWRWCPALLRYYAVSNIINLALWRAPVIQATLGKLQIDTVVRGSSPVHVYRMVTLKVGPRRK